MLIIALISCDGRDRKYKTNKDVFKENKHLDSFLENVSFHPVKYSEHVIDTILSNGFKIKIKTFTSMKHNVQQHKNKGALKYKHYFRKLISDVLITKNTKEIFNTSIDERFLSQFSSIKGLNLKSSIISASLDQLSSLEKDNIVITCMIYHPKKNNLKLFNLIIDELGNYILEKKLT